MEDKEVISSYQGALRFIRHNCFDESPSQLLTNLEKLKDGCLKLLPYAKAACYKNIKANGFYSLIKIVVKFNELVKRLSHDKATIADFTEMSSLLLWQLNSFFKVIDTVVKFKNGGDVNNNKDEMDVIRIFRDQDLIAQMNSLWFDFFRSVYFDPSKQRCMSLFIVKYSCFWDESGLWLISKAIIFALCLWFTPPLKIFKHLWSADYKLERYAETHRNMSIELVTQLSHVLDYRLLSLSKYLYKDSQISHQEVLVSSTNRFIFDEDASKIEICKDEDRKSSIRCLVSRSSNNSKAPENVILYFHGGAFFILSAESHQVCLNEWVRKIPNLCTISVSYTLRRRFHVPLQEALDVYMWLTTEKDDVFKKLGFIPKKIVLAGESAGGNLAFGLILALHDIQKDFVPVTQPFGFFASCSALNASYEFWPSLRLSTFDSFTPTSAGYQMSSVMSGWFEEYPDKSEETSWISRTLRRIPSLYTEDVKVPNFLESEHHLKFSFEFNCKRNQVRYASPMLCSDMEAIRIPLYLFSSEFCCLLDQSIALAKSWKGPVKLDVFPDLPHGFLHFCAKFPHGKAAMAQSIKRLKEAFELDHLAN